MGGWWSWAGPGLRARRSPAWRSMTRRAGASRRAAAPVGDLRASRASAQATLLADGMVSVTGGWWVGEVEGLGRDSAELFDPRTNLFTPLGQTPGFGGSGQAVRLQDGRV